MFTINLKIKDNTFRLDELFPFSIAVVDLIYDGDIQLALDELKKSNLIKPLETLNKLSDIYDEIVDPEMYSPIYFNEFKRYLDEAGIDFSKMENGTFSGYKDMVMRFADKDQYKEAHAYLDLLYESGFDIAGISELKGTLLLEEGKIEEGKKWLEKAIEEDPTLTSAYSSLGQMYFNNGNFKKAIEYWECEISIAPNHIVTYFMLADAYLMQNEKDKAVNILETLIENDEKNLLARYQLVNILDDMGEKEKAEKHKKQILETEPVYSSDIEIWARMQFEEGNFEKAKYIIEKLLETSPDLEHLKIILIVPYIKLGLKEKACELLKEFKDERFWYFYGKKELFEEFLNEEERKVCEMY
ncbi:MAG: tetratricopeptide repeat protein [Kosmotogaceae bacterium]